MAAGRVVSRGNSLRSISCRLHHRLKTAGHFRRGVFRGLSRRPRSVRAGFDRAALSLDGSYRPNDAGPDLVELYSSDWRGRRGDRWTHHVVRTLPTIVSVLTAGLKDVRAQRAGTAGGGEPVERDLPMKFALIGSAVLLAMIWALLTFKPIPGAGTGLFSNLAAASPVMAFGFLFVTVSSRICGLIGTSSIWSAA